MQEVDLRSDTVTRPSEEMRRAMAAAEVGDDVYGEDPTARLLEEEAAAAVGKEAALFVPSGTMGNQIAIHLQTQPGDEVLAEAMSHVLHYEMGAMAALSGVQPKPLLSVQGQLDPETVRAAIVRDVPYQSRTSLLVLENSHNLGGGTVSSPAELAAVVAVARERGLSVHLDGARVFNAASALGCSVAEIAREVDSVMFCLSKGLGAPVGSMLCGSADWISEARRVRKMLGGGMRQVGVLAAAGRIALRDGPPRLAEDHANAAHLAAGLAELPAVEMPGSPPRTNIVVCELHEVDALDFVAALAQTGVKAIPLVGGRVRFVTHRDVDRAGVEQALAAAREALSR